MTCVGSMLKSRDGDTGEHTQRDIEDNGKKGADNIVVQTSLLRPSLVSRGRGGAHAVAEQAHALAVLSLDPSFRTPLCGMLARSSGCPNGVLGDVAAHAVGRVCVSTCLPGDAEELSEAQLVEEEDSLRLWTSLLRSVSVQAPVALRPHLATLVAWLPSRLSAWQLQVSCGALEERRRQWLSTLCDALVTSLPSHDGAGELDPLLPAPNDDAWLTAEAALSAIVDHVPSFAALVDRARPWYTFNVVASLCAVAAYAPGGTQRLQARMETLSQFILDAGSADVVGSSVAINVHLQADLCQKAWIFTALFACGTASHQEQLDASHVEALGKLCTQGPITMRPAILPCMVFLVYGSGPSLACRTCFHEALQAALGSDSKALRSRALGSLAWLFERRTRERAGQAAGAAVKVSEDVLCVAELLPDILRAQSRAGIAASAAAFDAQAVVEALSTLGSVPRAAAESAPRNQSCASVACDDGSVVAELPKSGVQASALAGGRELDSPTTVDVPAGVQFCISSPSDMRDGASVMQESGVEAPANTGGSEAWRRFSPAAVNSSLCMARTWNGGAGGQCRNRQHGTEFCNVHAKVWEVHGRVDGPIPDGKLRAFQRASVAAAARSTTTVASSCMGATPSSVEGLRPPTAVAAPPYSSAASSGSLAGSAPQLEPQRLETTDMEAPQAEAPSTALFDASRECSTLVEPSLRRSRSSCGTSGVNDDADVSAEKSTFPPAKRVRRCQTPRLSKSLAADASDLDTCDDGAALGAALVAALGSHPHLSTSFEAKVGGA